VHLLQTLLTAMQQRIALRNGKRVRTENGSAGLSLFAFGNLHRQTAENWMSGNTVVRTIATGYDADSEVMHV
jgi:hypothetical protein